MAAQESKPRHVALTLEEYDVVGLELERSIHLTQIAMRRLADEDGEDLTLMSLLLERLQKAEQIVDGAGMRERKD